MAGARVHNPQNIKASFGGRSLDHGRDEGDFLSTEYLAQQTTTHVGADGSVTVSQTANQAGKATINCMSTSDTHRLLTALYERQRAFGVSYGVFELADLNNQIVERAAEAWIESAPPNAYGAEVGKRAWVLGLAKLERSSEGTVLT
jgi:hypothetical protein